MRVQYRFNFAVQFAVGGAVFICALILSGVRAAESAQLIGAALIGAAGFLLAGYRIRGARVRNIFILLGHPNSDETHGSRLADAYERGAREAGYNVIRQDLADLRFDPVLHKGYEEVQELEPDLKEVQENMQWADHVVIVYPNWWSTMPALLKGLFDRLWLPGFAFNFGRFSWEKLLKGRTGRVIITLDNVSFFAHILFGDYTNEIQNAILEFAGIHPTNVSQVDALKFRSEKSFQRHVRRAYRMGSRAL